MLIPGYENLELTFSSVFNLVFDPFDLDLLEGQESAWRRATFYLWYMTFEVSIQIIIERFHRCVTTATLRIDAITRFRRRLLLCFL